jgi:hypothetical protein
VLGPRLPRNTRTRCRVVAIARFVDAGREDPKWICSEQPLRASDRAQLAVFFAMYVPWKRLLNALRHRVGITRYDGLEPCAAAPVGDPGSR